MEHLPSPLTLAKLEKCIARLNLAWRLYERFEANENEFGMRLADLRIMACARWLEERGIRDLIDLECNPETMQFSLPESIIRKLKEEAE